MYRQDSRHDDRLEGGPDDRLEGRPDNRLDGCPNDRLVVSMPESNRIESTTVEIVKDPYRIESSRLPPSRESN